MHSVTKLLIGLSLSAASVSLTFAATAPSDPALLSGLKARSIGPAAMSGRVAAIAAVPSDTNIVYVGAASGGVWKTENAGVSWTPVFDKEAVHAIGALSIDPKNPNHVWVGTGEGNVRNSTSIGRGVYKTTDGGKSWALMGLKNSERVDRVIIHPNHSDTVFVAALGPLWNAGGERGVFRTRDGGKTFENVLKVNDSTGAGELEMDPSNPNKMFAGMWQFRRWPDRFKSGGEGSGVYRTVDGGDTWQKLGVVDGLPEGELGRISVAFAPSDSRIVYMLVEAKKNVLLKSTDGGYKFTTVNSDTNVHPRPFYFSDIQVDPQQPNRLYKLAVVGEVSDDGGASFRTFIGWDALHPDHHALWIHPKDGRVMINGNDGGIGFSQDRGQSWRFAQNLPLSQFYHVRYDMDTPYNVYGGLQDNGSWRGPSSVWENGPIRNHHWVETHFGDGFDSMPDPEDSMRGYAISQQGYIVRYDLRTGMRKMIRPAPADAKSKLRFNWNVALAQDPFDAATIYLGSQFVHKSTNRGDNWNVISPDLSSNNPEWQQQDKSGGLSMDATGAENRTTIITLVPSNSERGVLWAGTDDGRLHITRDGGGSWTSLEKTLKGAPNNGAYIPHIHVSNHQNGSAFVVMDNHRNGDMQTYLYRVDDFGNRATRLNTKGVDGYALSVVEDTLEPNLIFLGTELGLYISHDAGDNWYRFDQGLPRAVSVMDMAIHPREHDLIIGTHGRGIFIVDDIRALRVLASSGVPKALAVLSAETGLQRYNTIQGASGRFLGHNEFAGENKPRGALISWWMSETDIVHPDVDKERTRRGAIKPKDDSDDDASSQPQMTGSGRGGGRRGGGASGRGGDGEKIKIEISDSNGKVIRTQQVEAKQGLNRWNWELARNAARSPRPAQPWETRTGAQVLPGTYKVTLIFRKQKTSADLQVKGDPRITENIAALTARDTAITRLESLSDTVAAAVIRLNGERADIERVKAQAAQHISDRETAQPGIEIEKDDAAKKLLKLCGNVLKDLEKAEHTLWHNPRTVKGYMPSTDASSKISDAEYSLTSSYDAPTAAALQYLNLAEQAVQKALDKNNQAIQAGQEKIKPLLDELKLGLLKSAPLSLPQP